MLIGDAAHQADPLNRGGIHTAMESAFCAAEACRHALSVGDFSRTTLSRYESLWGARFEPDWRMSEIFMSVAKNPNLKDFCLFLLRQIGKLTAADPRFRDFSSGVFSGVVSQSAWLSPRALYDAFPKDAGTWLALLRSNGREVNGGTAAGSIRLASGAIASVLNAGANLARSPDTTLHWGMDVAAKIVRIAERQLGAPAPAAAHSGA
jgi:hypothetical protein